MANESVTNSLNAGSRIWRFLTYNAIATTIGAVVFALTFQNVLVAVTLTMSALVIGLIVIFREMWTLLGDDTDRLSHAEPAPLASAVQASRHAQRTQAASVASESSRHGGASLAH